MFFNDSQILNIQIKLKVNALGDFKNPQDLLKILANKNES
jgi:hypothetical protein